MARPYKKRCVGQQPHNTQFNPQRKTKDEIVLTLDEFETIKWIDVENLSQENCATVMNISRTTVQRTYASARKKIGFALVNSVSLKIEGGPIEISEPTPFKEHINEKGELTVKIAIGMSNNEVSGHFGHCNDFRIVDVVDGKVVSSEDIHDEVATHHERPKFLKNLNVEVLIIGGMGKGAYNRLLAEGIECLDSESKSIDEALNAYINNELNKTIEAHECSGHHGHGKHHDHGHHHHHDGHENCNH